MVILEVIIGIILIYFLLSLFASIIAERISKFIGMRGRILRRGIEHFLNDISTEKIIKVFKWKTFNSPDLFGWLKDFFAIESKDFKYSKAGEFYNLATIKYLAKLGDNKWYSIVDTKPSYISRENFLITVLSILDRRSNGINEWERVKFSIYNNTAHLQPDTLSMFQDWLVKSNDDFVVFKSLVLSHFDGQMDRVNGWYKKKIRNIIFFIGLFICLVFNADTIEIFKTLSNDPEKRAEMVTLAIAVTNAENSILDTLSEKKDETDSIALERLKKNYAETLTSIQNTNAILGNGWQFPAGLEFKDKVIFVIKKSFSSLKILGFLMTALALTLGAQFWFDLLKRLIAIRAVGKNPDEDKRPDQRIADSIIAKTDGLKSIIDDPVEYALAQHRPKWEKLNGFISANITTTTSNDQAIQLVFEKDKKPTSLTTPMKIKLDEKEYIVPLVFAEGELGKLNDSNTANKPFSDSICHAENEGTWGNVAGMVYSPRYGKNVALTCGHVIRNGKSSFIDVSNNFIKKYNAQKKMFEPFGKAQNLVLSSFCDAGIVALNRGINLPEKYQIKKVRSLKTSDEYVTKVTILNNENRTSQIKKYGQIIYTGYYRAFGDFPAEPKRYYNLFMIENAPNTESENDSNAQELPLSSPGDSGSLIVDDQGIAVGLLVGGGSIDGTHFSYGIDIQDVFDILQLQPYKA